MDNTCPLRITATAGTKLVGANFSSEIFLLSSVRTKFVLFSLLFCFYLSSLTKKINKRLTNNKVKEKFTGFTTRRPSFINHSRKRLDQAFAHCPIFLTAAFLGSLALISMPLCQPSSQLCQRLWTW